MNAMVNYTLAAGRMESEQLMVRSDTGEICVRTPLDRETAPYLEIPVIATDRGMYTLVLGFLKPPAIILALRKQRFVTHSLNVGMHIR